jgi:NitT/TauT family transport system substrate-binding protein
MKAAVTLAGLSATGRTQGHGAVTVAVAPSADMAPLIIAVKKGFFEKQGLKAQMKCSTPRPRVSMALVAGQADITQNTEPPHLAARARGGKVVQVMTAYASGPPTASSSTSTSVKSVRRLRGQEGRRAEGQRLHFIGLVLRPSTRSPRYKVQIASTWPCPTT